MAAAMGAPGLAFAAPRTSFQILSSQASPARANDAGGAGEVGVFPAVLAGAGGDDQLTLSPEARELAAGQAATQGSAQSTPDAQDSAGSANRQTMGALLAALGRALRRPAGQTANAPGRQAGGQALGLGGAGQQSFSLSNALRSVFGNSTETTGLFDSIQRMMDELNNGDDELTRKLELLLRTLEKFNDRLQTDAASFARNFERALRQILESRRAAPQLAASALAPAQTLAVAQAQAAQASQASQASFVFEIEVTQSQDIQAAVAQLSDQGVNVQWVRVQQSSTFRLRIEIGGQQQPRQSEPLMLDLNGDGVKLTGYQDGVSFDINADGAPERVAFAAGGDAALAMDRNGDGQITSGKELFGDQNGAANGFEELAKLDENGDGVIDRRDSAYQSLGVIRDANRDGRLDPSEFMSLAKAGIESISLATSLLREDDGNGNTLAERGTFRWSDGRQGAAVDAWLGYVPGQRVNQTA